jgi:hypothetical protein
VAEQLRRAATLPPQDLIFVGDSSCLMGIDVPALRRALPGRRIESLCTIGYVGPAGYARMIEAAAARGAPGLLVLVLHPAQFQRDPRWEPWAAFGMPGAQDALPPGAMDALDHVRLAWLSPVLYTPLPGPYARYYGGEAALARTLVRRGGSLIDPAAGLRAASAATPPAPTAKVAAAGPVSYARNPAFEMALATLRPVLAAFGPERVRLLIAPVPDTHHGPGAETARAAAARDIADRLGLPPTSILPTPATLPAADFSTPTHLHRRGARLFTDQLLPVLSSSAAPAAELKEHDVRIDQRN